MPDIMHIFKNIWGAWFIKMMKGEKEIAKPQKLADSKKSTDKYDVVTYTPYTEAQMVPRLASDKLAEERYTSEKEVLHIQ
jgi:hypothetical protein